MNSRIYQLYLSLRERYGSPKDFWQKWCKSKKTRQDREVIALGAILTQRVNWFNVEKALKNLRSQKALSVSMVYQLGKEGLGLLEELIRPAGFYRQKAKRLFVFCRFITEQYGGLPRFFQKELSKCRQELLAIPGIGPETADSILLYSGNKPIFVIDEYTRRFARKHNLTKVFNYSHLQDLFQKNLPKDVKLYQDFHAMIVLEGKGSDWDLVSIH